MTEREFINELDKALELAQYQEEAKEALLEMMTGNELSGLRRGLNIAEQVLSKINQLLEQRKRELNDGSGIP